MNRQPSKSDLHFRVVATAYLQDSRYIETEHLLLLRVTGLPRNSLPSNKRVMAVYLYHFRGLVLDSSVFVFAFIKMKLIDIELSFFEARD